MVEIEHVLSLLHSLFYGHLESEIKKSNYFRLLFPFYSHWKKEVFSFLPGTDWTKDIHTATKLLVLTRILFSSQGMSLAISLTNIRDEIFTWRYTNADTKVCPHNLQMKSSVLQIPQFNIFHFPRYVHSRNCLQT